MHGDYRVLLLLALADDVLALALFVALLLARSSLVSELLLALPDLDELDELDELDALPFVLLDDPDAPEPLPKPSPLRWTIRMRRTVLLQSPKATLLRSRLCYVRGSELTLTPACPILRDSVRLNMPAPMFRHMVIMLLVPLTKHPARS